MHPLTRAHARLLGPCFKTGRMGNCRYRNTTGQRNKPNGESFQPCDRPDCTPNPCIDTTAGVLKSQRRQQANGAGDSAPKNQGLASIDRRMPKQGATWAAGKCSRTASTGIAFLTDHLVLAHSNLNPNDIYTAPSVSFQTASRPLNSLSKVLCNFPSRYLFAIGLVSIFSLTRSSPRIRAALSSNPTLHTHLLLNAVRIRVLHPLWTSAPLRETLEQHIHN